MRIRHLCHEIYGFEKVKKKQNTANRHSFVAMPSVNNNDSVRYGSKREMVATKLDRLSVSTGDEAVGYTCTARQKKNTGHGTTTRHLRQIQSGLRTPRPTPLARRIYYAPQCCVDVCAEPMQNGPVARKISSQQGPSQQIILTQPNTDFIQPRKHTQRI
jgi:hypothetical protein